MLQKSKGFTRSYKKDHRQTEVQETKKTKKIKTITESALAIIQLKEIISF